MNKKELVSAMAEEAGLTKKDSEAALNAFMSAVQQALTENDRVSLVGFGSFYNRERSQRTGRNPQNPDEPINIPATWVPAFRPGKSLKEAVDEAYQESDQEI
jgi:DNA-binding protein HU-beta